MISISEAQLAAWIGPILWPFLRMLALFASAPVLSMKSVPMRLKIGLAFLVALAAQATLPASATIPLDSAAAVQAVVQNVLVGVTIGLAARIVFAALEYAGELVGLQMGLNFAAFFDPMSGSQSTAVSRFYGTLAAWIFITVHGHLMLSAAVIDSFQLFPATGSPLAVLQQLQPQAWGAEIFRLGLWIALPILGMLLFVNLALGVVARVAQQLNIFAIGFPITLGVGLIGMALTLPLMEAPFTMALEKALAVFR